MTTIIHFTESGDWEPDCNHSAEVVHARCPETHVVDQDEAWTDQEGTTWRLEDLTPSHRANLISWLRERASIICMGYWHQLWTSPFAPQGDQATLSVERIEQEAMLDPVAWLNETPLLRRLLELEEADEEARV